MVLVLKWTLFSMDCLCQIFDKGCRVLIKYAIKVILKTVAGSNGTILASKNAEYRPKSVMNLGTKSI